MPRQVLRFPVGRQFEEIIWSDNEWLVLTDLHLHPLVVREGTKNGVSGALAIDAFRELKQKIPEGQSLRIYNLHSHPRNQYVPSGTDLNTYIRHKIKPLPGIIEVGHGIITPVGIYIIRLPGKEERLKTMENWLANRYGLETRRTLNKDFNQKSWKDTTKHVAESGMNRQEFDEARSKARVKAFKKVLKLEPDIKTKMIRPTHPKDMRRLR